MKLPYKEGTTLQEIIVDGWSRGFMYEQTLYEAYLMGFDLSKQQLEIEWAKLEYEMDEYFGIQE